MSAPFDRSLTGAVDGGLGQDAGISPLAGDEERVVESALRPHSLTEFIGQPKVSRQLALVLEGAKRRGRPPDHVLLSGPPGLGKTSLALIIGSELGTSVKITSGPAIERSGDLAAMLSNLAPGDVLFIDEIHRIARPAEELLYMAMEDFRVDVVVGKGPGATAIPLEISPFTLVGATTRAGLLTGPLRDRFGFVGQMEFYEPAELQQVLRRSADLLGVELTEDGSAEIAGRSRGTPRIANRLLRRVRDYAEVEADGRVTREVAMAALALYDVDVLGLDRLDRAVLDALVARFGGGPVGVATLAVAVGEEPNTVEEVCEPFLVRAGLLARTPRGRVATEAAWHHLGYPLPAGGTWLGGAGGGSTGTPSTPGASSEPLFDAQTAGRWRGTRPATAARVRPVARAPCMSGNEATDAPERSHPGPHPPRSSTRGREAHLSWSSTFRSSSSRSWRSCCSCCPHDSASACRSRRRRCRSP